MDWGNKMSRKLAHRLILGVLFSSFLIVRCIYRNKESCIEEHQGLFKINYNFLAQRKHNRTDESGFPAFDVKDLIKNAEKIKTIHYFTDYDTSGLYKQVRVGGYIAKKAKFVTIQPAEPQAV